MENTLKTELFENFSENAGFMFVWTQKHFEEEAL